MYTRFAVLFSGLVASFMASAAPVDYAPISAAVDFSGVVTGILAVAALLAAVLVARKGAKLLLGFIK